MNVNGDNDRIAPALLGDAMTARATEAGDDARQVTIASTGHVELVTPGTLAFGIEADILQDMLATK